ncbi:MAG: hypothetical protein EOP84_03600 [Verrucomicrobiaceae bacterium]|nr:MAG: hypothetical protein EOP84_03600 [Verrucomicrobiaceae bacterium]
MSNSCNQLPGMDDVRLHASLGSRESSQLELRLPGGTLDRIMRHLLVLATILCLVPYGLREQPE